MQIRSKPEFVIEGQFLSRKNIWEAAFAEEISPYFTAPSQDGLDSLPHLVTRWLSGLSPCPSSRSQWLDASYPQQHCFIRARLPGCPCSTEKYFS